MQEFMAHNPGVIDRRGFNQQVFRENLVRQLTGIDDEFPPLNTQGVKRKKEEENERVTEHCPVVAAKRRNCTVCWREGRGNVRSRFACAKCKHANGNPVNLCIQEGRLCFQVYHSAQYVAHQE